MVGPAIGTAPALIVAAALRPEAFLPLLGAHLVIHFLEGNVLVPFVMGNAAGISPFLVIASLLVGGGVGGLLGALVAVPIAASIEVVLERLQARDQPVTPTADAGTDMDAGIDTDAGAGTGDLPVKGPQAPRSAL